jgi:hypothetical protein
MLALNAFIEAVVFKILELNALKDAVNEFNEAVLASNELLKYFILVSNEPLFTKVEAVKLNILALKAFIDAVSSNMSAIAALLDAV